MYMYLSLLLFQFLLFQALQMLLKCHLHVDMFSTCNTTCTHTCGIMYMYIVVAVHNQDSMRFACVNVVLAVHCNKVPKQNTCIYELSAVIQNRLYEHFIPVCCLGTSNKCIHGNTCTGSCTTVFTSTVLCGTCTCTL